LWPSLAQSSALIASSNSHRGFSDPGLVGVFAQLIRAPSSPMARSSDSCWITPAVARSWDANRSTAGNGMKRSGVTGGYGIPLDRTLAGANRHSQVSGPRQHHRPSTWTRGMALARPAPCPAIAASRTDRPPKAAMHRPRPHRAHVDTHTPGRTPSVASPAHSSPSVARSARHRSATAGTDDPNAADKTPICAAP
jgi:hypothetical protein